MQSDPEKVQKVSQIHYKGWPDYGVPSGKSMDDFENLINRFLMMVMNSHSTEKAVIHCSAGVGRTGTTITLAHLLINISS